MRREREERVEKREKTRSVNHYRSVDNFCTMQHCKLDYLVTGVEAI